MSMKGQPKTWSRFTVLLAISLAGGCGPKRIPAPTAYEPYGSQDGFFHCQAPSGWEKPNDGGRGGIYNVTFRQGSASIKIATNVQGSVIGDIAQGVGGAVLGEGGKEDETPVQTLHRLRQQQAGEEIGGRYEEAGEAVPFESRLGRAMRSEFTTVSGLGAASRGFRVTVLGNQRAISVICICPQADWETLGSAFEKVIESLGRGPVAP